MTDLRYAFIQAAFACLELAERVEGEADIPLPLSHTQMLSASNGALLDQVTHIVEAGAERLP